MKKNSLLLLVALFFFFPKVEAENTVAYDRIEVIVNNRVITKNEIDMTMLEFMQEKNARPSSLKERKAMRQQTMERLIDERLLDIQAEKLAITITDDELDTEIDQFQKRRKLTDSAFEELLQTQNFSNFSFRKLMHDRLLRERVILRNVRSSIQISDDELKKHFEAKKEQVSIRARHILRLVSANASPEEEKKAQEEIIWIKDKINHGDSFEQMAQKYSQDPSVKSNHGDLGFFHKEDMVEEFSDVAFSLEKGVLSDPVRTKFGFHLIEVLDKKMLPKAPFEQVKNKLYSQYYQELFQKKLVAYFAELRKNAHIVYYKSKK